MDSSLMVIRDYSQQINNAFGRAVTTLEGWLGTIGLLYFQPGKIGAAIFGLCIVDLFTGTMVALKIKRWAKDPNAKPSDYPELAQLVASGKKEAFTWKKWGQWGEKMIVVLALVGGGEWFKLYLSTDAWSREAGNVFIAVVYFVLLFTTFRSSIRNTALVTDNNLLMSVWKWLGGDSGLPTNLAFLQQGSSTPPPGGTTVSVAVEVTDNKEGNS